MATTTKKVTLGIDIGTTKVAAALVDAETKGVLATASQPHESDVQGLSEGRSEQVVARIVSALESCILSLPAELRAGVISIGATGQMHGVVLWNPDSGHVSHLVTWQDQRCLEDNFLEQLRSKTGDATAQSGYGTSTLSWLSSNDAEFLRRFSKAATIHDYLVAMITGNPDACTDPSNAASWGMFDLRGRSWDIAKVQRAGVAPSLLPEVKPAGAIIGRLSERFAGRWGIPVGIPVGNALGDNQASLYGSLTNPAEQVALTVGTGAQLSVVVSKLPAVLPNAQSTFEFRPYVGDSYIAVAASLTGGRALAALGKAIEEFLLRLGLREVPTLDQIQTAMHEQGMLAIATDLRANPSLSGERYAPSMRGSFSELSFDNFTVGDMTSALCRGLVTGLRNALPTEYLVGRSEVVGSGNAIRRSALMQQTIREVFGCSLALTEGSETTACGAALLVANQRE